MRELPNLNDMILFVEVARNGSFSAASRALGVPNPTLSRRIAAMEARLGVRLFERSTRRVALTSAGLLHFDRCAHLADEVRLAEDDLRDASRQPEGHIRVAAPVDFGLKFIGPALYEFSQLYPKITFELDLASGHRDLVGEKIDVAFRLGSVQQDSLVVRRIGWVTLGLYASPAYLGSYGTPVTPANLAAHACITLPNTGPSIVWDLSNGTRSEKVAVRGRFTTNNVGMMEVLAERGAGIAILPSAVLTELLDSGRLQAVLPGWELPRLPLHVVTTSRMQSARVKLMIDFLAPRLAL